MTSTTLATAGTLGLTAAGGYLFGPLGAGAGALVGSFLFGSASQKVEGPRLGDLSVAASSYGGVIPVGFGTQKVAGTMIWATDIREEKHTNTQGGGLFGGGTKVVEYRYFANFAVALGEGPAGAVTRIWAGDKLIARLRSSDHAKANHPKYRFRIYLGTEDQQPDPLIRKHVPANAAPAHRGLVYIVFEDLPLDEFGNRVPPITAEVSWGGAADAVANAAAIGSTYAPAHAAVDPARNRGFLRASSGADLVRFRLNDMTAEFRRPLSEVYPGEPMALDNSVVDQDGNLYAFVTSTAQIIVKIDGDSLSVTDEVHAGTNGSMMAVMSIYDLSGRTDWVLWVGLLSTPTRLMRTEDLSESWRAPTGVSSRPRGVVAGRKDFGRAEAFVLAAPTIVGGGDTSFVVLRHIVIEPPFFVNPISGEVPGLSFQDITITAAELGFTTIAIRSMAYDAVNDRIVCVMAADDPAGPRYMFSYSVGQGVVWVVPVHTNDTLPAGGRFLYAQIWTYGGLAVTVRSAEDGSVLFRQTGFPHNAPVDRLLYDPQSNVLYAGNATGGSTGIFQVVAGRGSDTAMGLDDVVTALCGRVGLTEADLDVSELSSDEVRGFGIARQISVRGALELLAATYAFEAIESDHQLKFKKRGRPPSRVISEDDLAPLSDRETFRETRAQEVDLPLRFAVRYQDADLDADEGTQTAKRIAGPDATMASHNEATLDLPLTLTATQAMTVALRQLYGAWLERVMHQWQTDWTHLDLEPGDVVQIALHDGSLFAVRLLQCELGANLAVSWQTVVEESSSYTVPAVPAAGLNYIHHAEPVSSEAKLFLLDIPLLQDLDDVQRVATGHYWAGGAYVDPPWEGAVLFSSDDGAVYASIEETFAAVSWGAAINALPDTDTPFQTDTTSELRVTMASGELSSVTALEMLNGANRAALIRSDGIAEIIQFQDAVLDNGVYTLTNLLRGRRGTEVFTGGHAAGDLFVPLDGVSRRGLPLSRIGATLHHRLVGRGGELRDAATNVDTLVGRDLMPYAPAHLTLDGEVGGGDIAVTWVRRTRVGGALLDGTGDVPLAEDEERYELVVYDGADNVLRTVTDLSSPAFTYTAAMQAADFPAGGPGRIAVWQISGQVGHGFEAGVDLEFAP
jgi:Putative phage tail protein